MVDNENKEKKPKLSWKGQLAEGFLELFFELVLAAVAIAFGFLILSVYPKEKLANVDAEFVMLIGVIGLIIPVGLIMLVCHIFKKRRSRKMVNCVYKALKHKYELKTVVLTRKLHDEYTDMYVLKGKSSSGSFELYRDGLDLVFSPQGGKEIRLNTTDDAILKIEMFMAQ